MSGSAKRDYGHLARIGVLTPQSNPTVEPEMGLLFPHGVSMLVSRCTSKAEPRQRFLDYFRDLEKTLENFDSMQLEAVGFGCTASSYLLDPGEESSECARLQDRFDYPLITAAAAIKQALEFLGVRKIALACPYPDWLLELARSFWSQQGYDILHSISVRPDMGDTRAIYKVSGADASDMIGTALKTVTATDAIEAVVITGTGMPGLQAVCDLQQQLQIPVFNSNLALAWACLQAAGVPLNERSPRPEFPLLGGWSEEISRL
jgi:maleate isomerase